MISSGSVESRQSQSGSGVVFRTRVSRLGELPSNLINDDDEEINNKEKVTCHLM